MRGFRLTLLTLAMLTASRLPAQVSPEYKLKAAFLFNFTKFVDWPATAFEETTSPVVIGILGEDPFDGALEEVVQGRVANGRPLAIRRSRRVDDLRGCHVLFICASEKSRQAQITASFKGSAVLTVSDTGEFLASGGMIKVTLVDRKPRLEIDAAAAERAGLKIQAQLMELATPVGKERS